MSIADLMRTPVQTVPEAATIAEAARLMVSHSVGALVLTDEAGTPSGMVTDRDLVTMIADGMNSEKATLNSLARGPLITKSVDDDLQSITAQMRQSGVRRMPILARDGSLAGIVSLDDLLIAMARTFSEVGHEVFDIASALKVEFLHEHAITTHLSALRR